MPSIPSAIAPRTYVYSCSDDNSCSNHGCVSDTWYNDLWHKNIAFTDKGTGEEFFYSTQWKLTHPANVEKALQANGFELGARSGENCGFQFQQNIGNPKAGSYLGTLWVRTPSDNMPFNSTAVDQASKAIGSQPATLEKALAGTSPFIIVGGLAALCAVSVGLCLIPTGYRAMKKVLRDSGNAIGERIQQHRSATPAAPADVEFDTVFTQPAPAARTNHNTFSMDDVEGATDVAPPRYSADWNR